MSAAWASSRTWLRRSRRPDSSRSRTVSVSRAASAMTTGLGRRGGALRRARGGRSAALRDGELRDLGLELTDPGPEPPVADRAAQRGEDHADQDREQDHEGERHLRDAPEHEADLDRGAVLE